MHYYVHLVLLIVKEMNIRHFHKLHGRCLLSATQTSAQVLIPGPSGHVPSLCQKWASCLHIPHLFPKTHLVLKEAVHIQEGVLAVLGRRRRVGCCRC